MGEVAERLELMAQTIRRDVIRMIYRAGAGHPGSSLSAADIVTALYFHFMRVRPEEPMWPERDRFVLSKGHACPVWYAALARRGFFSTEELLTLRKINSRLQGHPDMRKTPGVDMTTGSLGQGLSAGVGMALGLKLGGIVSRVFVVLGDGELDEGQTWEAAMAASKFQLDNLTAILDYNGLQLDGPCEQIMPIEPVVDKWYAFGWYVLEMNGHKMPEILETIQRALNMKGKPVMIVAHTVKGKGVSYMEDQVDWHGKVPNEDQYLRAMADLSIAEQEERCC